MITLESIPPINSGSGGGDKMSMSIQVLNLPSSPPNKTTNLFSHFLLSCTRDGRSNWKTLIVCNRWQHLLQKSMIIHHQLLLKTITSYLSIITSSRLIKMFCVQIIMMPFQCFGRFGAIFKIHAKPSSYHITSLLICVVIAASRMLPRESKLVL